MDTPNTGVTPVKAQQNNNNYSSQVSSKQNELKAYILGLLVKIIQRASEVQEGDATCQKVLVIFMIAQSIKSLHLHGLKTVLYSHVFSEHASAQ